MFLKYFQNENRRLGISFKNAIVSIISVAMQLQKRHFRMQLNPTLNQDSGFLIFSKILQISKIITMFLKYFQNINVRLGNFSKNVIFSIKLRDAILKCNSITFKNTIAVSRYFIKIVQISKITKIFLKHFQNERARLGNFISKTQYFPSNSETPFSKAMKPFKNIK